MLHALQMLGDLPLALAMLDPSQFLKGEDDLPSGTGCLHRHQIPLPSQSPSTPPPSAPTTHAGAGSDYDS
jgi:hypothetical protein